MAVERWLAVLAFAAAVLGAASAQTGRVIAAGYPEGPLFQGERLYFADMHADRVVLSDETGERTFFSQRGCGPTAIAPYAEGFVILCHLGARVVAVDAEGRERRRWARDANGDRLANPNDASADGRGGVYFSDPGRFDLDARPRGRIMYLSADGVLTPAAGPLRYPNGVHVAGQTLFVSEHLGGRVLRYAIEAPGRLGRGETFVDLKRLQRPPRYQSAYALSGPDGLETGPDGTLYVALYGEGRLLGFSPQGQLSDTIEAGPRFVTNVAFGAPGMAITGAFDNTPAGARGEVRVQARPH